ncbi:MAG: heme-binding protein [Bacillota bacterium]|nr:heme-binding protein [Bacillota bacterium]MDW7678572.1 heme-binding protein [Bacillota bacterium]
MKEGEEMGFYETPEYEVVLKDSPFEIRRYSDFLMVEYENEEDPFSQNGFGTLFRYISNDNEERQRISMTVPVIEEMTEEKRKMAFVVPRKHWENTPKPNNPHLGIKSFDSGIFAVIRYSGLSNRQKEQENWERLVEWADQKGYRRVSNAMLAFYNSPFALPMVRRNEIMVRVEAYG